MTDAAALLARLVAVGTANPGGDERGLGALLRDELRARGADEVELVETDVGGRAGAFAWARFGAPEVLVNAHLDTVPPNSGWHAPPLAARVDGGRLYGLGACDTKGAIAAILAALDEARPRRCAILFSGDEERGQTVMRSFLAGPRAGGLARAVVCEPTGLRAGTRHRGILGVETRLAGRGGHSSLADALPAPVAELGRLAAALHEHGARRRGDGPPGFPGLCMNVARLDGGVAFNVVPDAAALTFSVRPPPGSDAAAVRAELLALCAATVPAAASAVLIDNPPFATRDLAAFRSLLGDAVDAPIDLGFWTEAALLAERGIDAVVFGPGDIAQAHAPDEWLSLDQLEGARRAFVALFRNT